MAKIFGLIASFLVGVIVTAITWYFAWENENPRTTVVWTLAEPLKLNGGVVLPKNTELIQHRWMPEGFVTLKLYVNVEGAALEKLDQHILPRPNVVNPGWVAQ